MAGDSTTGLEARVGAPDLPPSTLTDEEGARRHSRARCRLPRLRRRNASSRCCSWSPERVVGGEDAH